MVRFVGQSVGGLLLYLPYRCNSIKSTRMSVAGKWPSSTSVWVTLLIPQRTPAVRSAAVVDLQRMAVGGWETVATTMINCWAIWHFPENYQRFIELCKRAKGRRRNLQRKMGFQRNSHSVSPALVMAPAFLRHWGRSNKWWSSLDNVQKSQVTTNVELMYALLLFPSKLPSVPQQGRPHQNRPDSQLEKLLLLLP